MADENDDASASLSNASWTTNDEKGLSDPGEDGSGSDSFTVTETKSWFQRLGFAILAVFIGLVLVIGMGVLLFWNESRAVTTARSLTEGAGLVVEIDSARVDRANDGRLVHLSGDLQPSRSLADPTFAVTASGAVRLVRTVEMYQWKEDRHTETHKNLGGGEESVTTYTYTRTWSDHPIESGRFRQPSGHQNPPMRYARFETVAEDAAFGAFRPGGAALRRLDPGTNFRVEAGTQPPRETGARVVDGGLYIGGDPGQPRIGDLRITYHIAPTGPASFIGRQQGASLGEYQTKAGDRLLLASAGLVPAAAMFKQAQDENVLITWILRAVGLVGMFIGFCLMVHVIGVVGDIIPPVGNVLAIGAFISALLATVIFGSFVIALAWLWVRPLVAGAVLAAGALALFGLKRHAAHRRAVLTQMPQPPQAAA